MDDVEELRRQLAEARTANATLRLRTCDVHAAVYRAMRSTPEEALAAVQDDGYVHAAVHAALDSPDGTAQVKWDAAAKAHVEALGDRALLAEAEVAQLRMEVGRLTALLRRTSLRRERR